MRRTSSNSPRSHGFLTAFAVVFAFGWLNIGTAHAEPWHSLDDIAAAAVKHAQTKLAMPGARVKTSVKSLDTRLKLRRCQHALQTFLPDHVTELRRNATVGVRCTAPKPWKLYVPVQVAIYRPVLVANRPLGRGAVLSAADVRTDERDVATVRSAYLTDVLQLDGKVLRRSLAEGTLITIDHLNEERIVKRGQSVTLLVNRGGLQVRMAGTALSDGTINQRIQVENHSSKRVVEGVVRSQQLVEVVM